MKLILGLGDTGLSIAQFLSKHNIAYRLADSRINPPRLTEYNKSTNTPPILGSWSKALLNNIDEIFISPGIAQTQSIVIWARQKNIPISSDIELFSRHAKAAIIGITGSNGKSTVTQLLGNMIARAGKRVMVGGNIGKPALDCLSAEVDFYVLELSSYQLDYTQHLNLLTGVVLNITPEHLDRYTNFEQYINSKLSLYQYCQQLVINNDEPLVPKKTTAKHFGIDIPKHSGDFGSISRHGSRFLLKGDTVLMDINKIQLIGEHNISNILCALSLGDEIGLNIDSMVQSVKDFPGLEHRLEWVGKKQAIDYYNDSKATNPISTIKAITALIKRHKNIVLIAGGIAKQQDYCALFALINQKLTNVVLIGQNAKQFATGIRQAQANNTLGTQISYANSMQQAINFATAKRCDAVLLSPACASFDMFDNFEHRGRVFKKLIS